MKIKKIKLPIFDFDITFIEVENKSDDLKIIAPLSAINYPKEMIEEVCDNIKRDVYDGGDTIRNMEMMRIVVIVYRCKSESTRRNVINHELRHVVDRICEHLSINDIETPAYITGYLSEKIY